MRTTVSLDDDVAAEVSRLRKERGIGVSEAVNALIREGLTPRESRVPFIQESSDMGALLDLSNIAEVLDLLEGPDAR